MELLTSSSLNLIGPFDAEGVFGGVILLAVLTLLLTGKLRFEREVKERDEAIKIKDKTIEELLRTTQTLTHQAEVTNALLDELRMAPYRRGEQQQQQPHSEKER